MYKLKKGIELFSSHDFRIISVLLESLKVKPMVRIYSKMTKHFLMSRFHKFSSRNPKPLLHKSIAIADFLNDEYHSFSHENFETKDSFYSLLERNYKKESANTFNDLYYNIIHAASKLYPLPETITPAEKADLISVHAYLAVLKNLKKIIQSIPEHQLVSIETTLDLFITQSSKPKNLALKELFQLQQLTGQKILNLLLEDSFHEKIVENDTLPKILMETVNTVIDTLCDKADEFTQINSKIRTFILFQFNESFYWILEVSPHLITKGSKYMTQEIASMIIFLSKILLDESYLPLEHELPSFNLTKDEKDTLLRRTKRFKSISFQVNDNKKQLKTLENQLVQGLIYMKNLSHDKKECEESIIFNKERLIPLNNSLIQSEAKLERMLKRFIALESKQSNNPRVKEKLISLSNSCDALKLEIELSNERIHNSKNTINQKKNEKKQLENELINNNRNLKETKIEVALLTKQIEAYEQEKSQLEASNSIYFTIHWGRFFDSLKISQRVYDSLLHLNIDFLLIIERILVELNESSTPEAVGQKIKGKENIYIISIRKGSKFTGKISYAVYDKNIVELLEIRT